MAEIAAKSETTPLALHINLPFLYRRKVEELKWLLADADLGVKAMDAIRSTLPGSC